MIDPILAEAVRAFALRTDVFRRLQRHLRDVVDPQLEERLQLLEENAALKDALAAKRGPGRPRQVPEPVEPVAV